jgi:hypothetical protein
MRMTTPEMLEELKRQLAMLQADVKTLLVAEARRTGLFVNQKPVIPTLRTGCVIRQRSLLTLPPMLSDCYHYAEATKIVRS